MATGKDHKHDYSSERPSLNLLYKHVVPDAATKWRSLGVELLSDDSQAKLGTIEANHPQDAEKCCQIMLEKWLTATPDASWNQLIQALEAPNIELIFLASQISKLLSEDQRKHHKGGSKKATDLYKDAYRPNQDPMFSDECLKKKYKNAKTAKEVVQSDKLSPEQKKICHAVQAMIINVNECELMATMSYLEPPNENYTTVLEVHRKIIIGHNPETAIFHIGMFGKCLVAVVRVEAGCAKVAIYQTDLFPKIVLVAAVGVAAGFPENGVKIGDVLVSERITDCSNYKHQNDRYIQRGTTFQACAYMMQRLKSDLRWEFQRSNATDDNMSEVKFGQFLSKPVLLDDPAEREKILKFFGIEAKGYEMEGFDLFGKIDCIIIKGVCDLAGGKTKKWQSTAALAANDYLYYHLSKSDLALQNDKHEDYQQDGSQQPIPVHVQPKDTGSDGEDQMEECDGAGLKQNMREEPDSGLAVPQPNNQFSPAVYAFLAVIIVMLAIITALSLRG